MKGKVALETIIGISTGALGILLMIFSIVYTRGFSSSSMIKTLEAIEKNTEKMPQTNLLLEGIQKNTDRLPEMAICISVIFERAISEPIRTEIEKGANPKLLPVCKKLLPEEVRNKIDRIVRENINRSAADLTAILIRELDFSQLLKVVKENNISIDKCLQNLGNYAANIRIPSKTK